MRKLLIWGTGNIATQLCDNGLDGEIVGFIETQKSKEYFKNVPVYSADEKLPDYDFIIVANKFSDEVYETCVNRKLNFEKFIFLSPVKRKAGESNLEKIEEILKEKNFINYCSEYGLRDSRRFQKDMDVYEKKNRRASFKIDRNNLWPVFTDKYREAGIVNNYFQQDLWAAKLIFKSGVKSHFDIGSRIDGFISHLLAMDIEVTLIDIRKFPRDVEGLHTIVDDATLLRKIPDDSIVSMSALCSLEHFGLGRYGDLIDPEACFKCFEEIQRKVKTQGDLYISLPVGMERVEFNAHRIFYPSTIVECFHKMDLVEFSCTAAGEMEYNVDLHRYDNDIHDGEYRYGLFHFKKYK